MDTKAVREQLAARLQTISGMQVHAYPPGTISAPSAVVQPQDIAYDQAYANTADRASWAVVVAAGKPHEQSSHELLDSYATGSGARSVKAVLESGTYTAFDDITVTRAEWDTVEIAGIPYLAALFTLDIFGSGG